ncbi:MAG: DUF1549 and DUF1553 domain-containing protein [Planctomycetaceae bacterium]|nr:DUF1549 and DUF1553 domain-containing protein [Planctomycetaceae bacterium]
MRTVLLPLTLLTTMAVVASRGAGADVQPRPKSEPVAKTTETTGPKVANVVVAPKKQTLAKDRTGRLTVTAQYFHGSRRNVTDQARIASLDRSVVAIEKNGVFRAVGFGQAYLVATFERRSDVLRVVVPRPLPNGFPKAESYNPIDRLVLEKLEELGIPPSEVCTDQEFVRRVFLDAIGTLPTPDEVRAFLDDRDPQKRSKLIDRLLDRSEFADFWALKWGDLLRMKSEFPSNLWPNAVQAYYTWVRQSIAENKPWDRFARELLVSSGCNFRDPPANFYRATQKRNPQGFAESAALVFMGARIGCASCHAHPIESWTLDDHRGMAAIFSQIKFKSTKEWKEEIVYLDPTQTLRDPTTKRPIAPKPLDDKPLSLSPGDDPRVKFALWLTSPRNPWFAKNLVNRIWFWLLGRGIVHEPDDLRPTNPPSNPKLLAYLERELLEHRFDAKHIYRLILNSAAYQRSSTPNALNCEDMAFFSHYRLRRLTAEELSDAIGQVTQVWNQFSSQIPEPYSRWPVGFRATQLADGSVGTPFLELFGRPPRDTSYESDRDDRPSMRQSLYMITSSDLEAKVAKSPRFRQWAAAKTSDERIVEEIFLLAFARRPTVAERNAALRHLAANPDARERSLQDLMWAAINTKEFLFNH